MNNYKLVPLGRSIGLAATLALTSVLTIAFMVIVSNLALS